MSVSVQTGAQQTPRHQQSSGTSSLLACVRESSPLPDPAEGDAAFDSYTGTTGTEPRSKKSRFHPLRGLRRMFRRKPRVEPTAAPESVPAGEAVSGEPTGSSLLAPDNGGQPRSRSASELLGSSQELQAKRRSGGGLSGGSGGGSGCALGGGLSVSHDSVFTSDGRGGGGSPRGGSALQLPGELDGVGGGASASAHMLAPQPIASHAGVRAELFEAVRRRRRGRNGRRSEDEEDEDLGLPSSPYGGSPTTADVLMERSGIKEAPTKSHSTCSDGSLLSMGSSEMDEDSQVSGHSSKVSLHDRAPPTHEPAATAAFGGTDFDLEMVGESLGAPLSHSAARHKIAVRPRRTHGAPRHHRRTQQMSSMVLPTTPEANEEFPRSYSPDNRGKRDSCLPESHADSSCCDTAEQQQTSPAPMFRCSSPPNGGMPLPLFFHPNPRSSIPAGLSPNSPEALLASVMLERQLKSASLPPGLALPPAAPPASQEPTVKLSRSQSSSDPAGSPPGRHHFRKAHSAARIEHQAALANEALSKSRAMFGGDAKEEKSTQPEPTSPVKEEKPLRSPVRKTSEDLPSPSHEEKSFMKPPPKPELPPSMKEDKPVFYKPPHSRKSEEPKSPVRLSEDTELPPVPGPKPESRKMSNVAMRQRIEPGLVSPEPPEEYSPPPWAPQSSTKMSTSHFIKLSDPCDADSMALRHKEMQERKFSSIKTRVPGFQTILQDAPSSLDSLEIENQAARRLRSLSQSPVDSLERTELKMSSDSLSSGADLSSTSDDPRPYRKHSRPRRPTPDTSDPEETKPPPPAPRPIKLRSVSRHSDPPFSGKNAVEVTSVIRKSVSVDSIRSSYSENITENQSNIQLPTTKTSTSNDSISSYDTNDSEKISNNVQETVTAAPLPVTNVRSHMKSDTKPVDITPLESSHLSLKCESVKTETETSKSPPVRWESKLPRMSLSTPSVPEFLRVQLNHVDSTPATNVVLSANAASPTEVAAEPKRQRLPSDKQDEEPDNEITSARVRLRKSFIEEPKVVDIAEKKQESTDSPAHILNRRPSQIKRLQELSLRVENDTKPQKIEVISPTEKVAPRAIAALVKEAEAKPKTEIVVEKRYSSTFIQPKLSVATPQLKPVEAKPVKHSSEPISNITIVSKATTVVTEPKESRANGVFTAKPVQTEKPSPAPKQVVAPAPKVMAPPPKVVAIEKSEPALEVVLRKKTTVTHEAKDDQPELMKVFARRSLKLKDTETWESQGSTQRSRDSDKENEDCPTEIREKKVTESKSFNNSVANNNVPATVISNTNNNNNGFSRKVPRAVSMAAVPSNSNHTNNNLEAVNTEVTLRQRSPENRPRPSSLADRIQGVWGGRNVELVSSLAAAPAAPVPATVATDNTVDRSLTPRVRRRLDEWERWSKQTSRKEALP